MPPKSSSSKPVTFALLPSSYASESEKAVLVPAAQVKDLHKVKRSRNRRPPILFGEDIDENLQDDVTAEFGQRALTAAEKFDDDGVFDDEVEEEFDENFIRQMITGEGVEDFNFEEDEDFEDGDPDEAEVKRQIAAYPNHSERRAEEKQFDRMMADFDVAADLDEAGARGALPVEAYGAHLEQFASDNVHRSFIAAPDQKKQKRKNTGDNQGDDDGEDGGDDEQHGGAPQLVPGVAMKHRGFIKQLNILSRNNEGYFGQGTVLTAGANKRMLEMQQFLEAAAEMREDTRQALRRNELREEDVTVASKVAAAVESAMRPDGSIIRDYARYHTREQKLADLPPFVQQALEDAERKSERIDCETVLTTMSSTFNLPNIIAATRRIKPQKHGALRKTMQEERRVKREKKQQQQKNNGKDDDDEEEDDEDGFRSSDSDSDDGYDSENDEGEMPDEAMTAGALSMALRDQRVILSTVPADETQEQKKARKALVKQMQREARAVKKQLKGEFAREGKQQESIDKLRKNDKRTATLSSIRGSMQVK